MTASSSKTGPRPARAFRRALSRCAWLLAAFAFSVTTVPAQTRGWQWQNPKPQGNPIHAIRFAADKKHGLAVGADGSILRTDDGGYDWEVQRSPVTKLLRLSLGQEFALLIAHEQRHLWQARQVRANPQFPGKQ